MRRIADGSAVKKVLIVLPKLDIGGAEKAVCRLASAFDRTRIVSSIAVFHPDGECLKLLPADVKVHTLGPIVRWRHLRLVFRLARVVRTERIDVVYSVLDYANSVALCGRIAGLYQAPLVIGVRSNYRYGLRPGVRRGWLRRFLVRAAYPRADLVLCVTDEARTVLIEEYGVPANLCATLGNIVPAIEENSLIDSEDGAIDAHFDRSRPVVLGVGRLDPVKDFEKLLEAFKLLQVHHAARLLLIGDGPERKRLMQVADRLGLGDGCVFVGEVLEPMRYMLRADCLVVTSRSEGFPNVVAEAIACGLPVVAFDWSPSVVEMVKGARLGRIVQKTDVKALADAIHDTLDATSTRGRTAFSERLPTGRAESTPARVYEDLFVEVCTRSNASQRA